MTQFDRDKPPWPFYEFFAGAGLARRGLGADWRCIWANDFDPSKRTVYEANYPGEMPDGRDVALVTPQELPVSAMLAWASFPCQDLSLAGWRRGLDAKRSGAFWGFWTLMQALDAAGQRPPLIVLENVIGLLSNLPAFVGLCEALSALRLQFGMLVMDASHFLPQSRPRVFIVAVDERVDCGAWSAKGPLAPDSAWVNTALRRAHAALPPALAERWNWWSVPSPTAPVAEAAELIDDDPAEAVWHTPEETQRLLEMMTPRNREKVQHAQARGSREVGFLYRRTRNGVQRAEVRFDQAGCLRTPEGGSSRQTVVLVRAGEVRSRLLTVAEAARLMGAPGIHTPGSYNDGYKAMGDGVAVPVVAWLSRQLLLPLATECGKLPVVEAGGTSIVMADEAIAQRAKAWKEASAK